MREILFKANRISDGEWVEGYYVEQYGSTQIYLLDEDSREYEFDCVHIDKNTLCQYTGLTDKNGNKIWENDVVKKVDTNALGWARERYCKVSFNKMGYWMITTEYGDGYWIGEFESEQLEVIGNIFDNPELVKEGDSDVE